MHVQYIHYGSRIRLQNMLCHSIIVHKLKFKTTQDQASTARRSHMVARLTGAWMPVSREFEPHQRLPIFP